MKLVALPNGIGRLEDDGSVVELDLPYPSLYHFLTDSGTLSSLRSAPARRRLEGPYGFMAPPINWPGAVFGIGLNYASKQRATGRPLPDHPTLFIKAAASVQMGGGNVGLPDTAPDQVDYEGEIAVVIGNNLYRVTVDEASRSAALVTAANDLTARDVMRATGSPTLAKSFPGFGQVSNIFLEATDLGALEGLSLETTVCGEVRQRDTSDGMIMSIAEVVACLSQYVALRRGDVVLTGTPAGTGDESGSYLSEGDTVLVTVSDLPSLRTDVVQLNGTV